MAVENLLQGIFCPEVIYDPQHTEQNAQISQKQDEHNMCPSA